MSIKDGYEFIDVLHDAHVSSATRLVYNLIYKACPAAGWFDDVARACTVEIANLLKFWSKGMTRHEQRELAPIVGDLWANETDAASTCSDKLCIFMEENPDVLIPNDVANVPAAMEQIQFCMDLTVEHEALQRALADCIGFLVLGMGPDDAEDFAAEIHHRWCNFEGMFR
jgi:hypothetical protein